MKRTIQTLSGVLRVLSGRPVPLGVSFVVTEKCNRSCLYCGNSDPKGYHPETKELEQIIAALATAGNQKLLLTGGEPLLRDDIGRLVSFAKLRNLELFLNTAGYRFAEVADELTGVSAITISLDGPKDFHDSLRGENSYQQATGAIALAKQKGIPVSATAVVTKNSPGILSELLSIAARLGVRVFFQPILLQTETAKIHSLSESATREFFTKLLAQKKENLTIGNSAYSLLYFAGKIPMPRCFGGRAFLQSRTPAQNCYLRRLQGQHRRLETWRANSRGHEKTRPFRLSAMSLRITCSSKRGMCHKRAGRDGNDQRIFLEVLNKRSQYKQTM